jgi:hypothetical protein
MGVLGAPYYDRVFFTGEAMHLTTFRLLTELWKPDCVPRANFSQGGEMAPSLCGRTSEFHKCHSCAKSELLQKLTQFCPPVSGSIPFKV